MLFAHVDAACRRHATFTQAWLKTVHAPITRAIVANWETGRGDVPAYCIHLCQFVSNWVMTAQRVKAAARMLPDTAPTIPMEAQCPKQRGQIRLSARRYVQPNPVADDLGNLVLPRQSCPQVIQDCFRGQFAIGTMPDKIRLCLARL